MLFPFSLSLTIVGLFLFTAGASANSQSLSTTDAALRDLARQAIESEGAEADLAIHTLRDAGPHGLEVLVETHADFIRQVRESGGVPSKERSEAWKRLVSALDAVGQQRDCYASRLYWYTDFEKAKAAAKAQGKPILSLRLLGKLDEEFSCANSRFFRTVLYANEEVSKTLRDRFILHWKSVRPVPKVTIDFGDGRKLERTITGNSIHYILDSDGQPVDALPGLYGPKAFLKGLSQAEQPAKESMMLAGKQRGESLRRYHLERLQSLKSAYAADLEKIGAGQALGEDAIWKKIAELRPQDSQLDAGSRSLMRAKSSTARDASRLSLSKAVVEDPLLRQIAVFQRTIGEDTVRNEYQLHRKLHEWFLDRAWWDDNLQNLNEKVYAELFLTPASDPWLGLKPQNIYPALTDEGIKPLLSSSR